MGIKQQKDIRKFLEGEYTFDTAEQIYKKQEDSLMAMLETVKNESKSRYKTLKQTILPRIALYKVLGEYTTDEERVKILRHYMIDIVASKKHAFTARMEIIPGFFYIYRAVFLKIMRTTELQQST